MITRDMPLHVKVQLRDVDGDWTIQGNEIENQVLIEASRLGYEVEEEYTTPNSLTEPKAFVHNVKVVNYHEPKEFVASRLIVLLRRTPRA